jgi:ribosomal protein S18 acetylase RimI-like enzyme
MGDEVAVVDILTSNEGREKIMEVHKLLQEYKHEMDERVGAWVSITPDIESDDSLEKRYLAVLLATSSGADQVMGIVCLREGEKDKGDSICEMKRLYCRSNCRGKGVARRLVEEALRQAQMRGFNVVRVDTLARLKEAISLYRSFGFTFVEPYTFDPQHDAVFLELKIAYPQTTTSS